MYIIVACIYIYSAYMYVKACTNATHTYIYIQMDLVFYPIANYYACFQRNLWKNRAVKPRTTPNQEPSAGGDICETLPTSNLRLFTTVVQKGADSANSDRHIRSSKSTMGQPWVSHGSG